MVEKDKQNTPSFSAEVMTGLARWKKPRERLIFILWKDMSDLYDKIKEDVAFRRKWAERCGFGFELPLSCTECTENCRENRSSRGSVSN